MNKNSITWVENERGCYICTSHRPGAQGYPRTTRSGKTQTLHRFLYEEKHGPLSPGELIRHTCDDRMCINTNHMVPGSHADNTRDKIERGRSNHLVGAGVLKFSAAQIKEIKIATGSLRKIAKQYGVVHGTIRRIKLAGAKQSDL